MHRNVQTFVKVEGGTMWNHKHIFIKMTYIYYLYYMLLFSFATYSTVTWIILKISNCSHIFAVNTDAVSGAAKFTVAFCFIFRMWLETHAELNFYSSYIHSAGKQLCILTLHCNTYMVRIYRMIIGKMKKER